MRKLALVAVVAVLVSACGGGGGSNGNGAGGGDEHADHGGEGGSHANGGHGSTDCTPQGTALAVTASGTAFSTDCLAAPARQPFTLTLDNQDTLPHNVAVLKSHTGSDVLFRGEIVMGPKKTDYAVPALDPGTYVFHCEVHPDQMQGGFVVK